jgi:glycosyltransferase involved in cell wall biosynthesis
MFGWEFPPYQAGGLATATVGLVKGLLRVGVDVTLAVPFPAEDNPVPGLKLLGRVEEARERLTVHRIESPLVPYGSARQYEEVYARTRPGSPSRPVYGANLFDEVERFAAIAGELAAAEPHDLIDAHDWITYAAGLAAREVSGRPLVAHIHATEFDRTGGDGNPEIVRRERGGMLAADRVISNSLRLKRQCVERYAVPAARIDVVHWGIDAGATENGEAPTPSPFDSETPVVLFLGRVTGQKGPDYFIEMAGRVAAFVPRARFVLAGSGDLLPRLMERSAELGIADRVHFTGGLVRAEVEQVIRMADVCVMPSRNEPFGIVALESLLHGTPCIVPKDSGVAEVVRNAFKVDCWDIDELTNKVVAILKHRVLQEELSELGRRELATDQFSLEGPAKLTALAYERALGAGAAVHA